MLRDLFERESNAMWAGLRRLAQRDPRLERLYGVDVDARVARLVQSGAFVVASALASLETDDQALTRPLVAAALPEALRPRPSSTILERSFREADARDVRGHVISAQVGGVALPFEAVWSAVAAPMQVADVRVDRIHAQRQVLRITFGGLGGVALGGVLPDKLRIYVHVEPRRVALDLLHALRTAGEPILVSGSRPQRARPLESTLPPTVLRWVRVDTDEPPLTSAPVDRFGSGTLLRDLHSFPESFSFLELDVTGVPRTNLATLTLTLPLARVVEEGAALSRENFRLFCTPATNHYAAAIEPIRTVREESEWPLAVAGRPHAEILHVRSMFVEARSDAEGRRPIASWEAPGEPHAFDPDDVYYRLEQSPHAARGELLVSFATLERFFAPAPAGIVEGEVLATDGALTAALGLGDVRSPSHGLTNISRVSPSHRAPLGQNHATRVSAYARMPARELADPVHLTAFVGLHDLSEAQDGQARVRRPQFLQMRRAREHTLSGRTLQWGDAFEVDVGLGACSEGEAWLVGALLARALAERSEAIDFSRLTLVRGGARRRVFAEYAPRPGERLPFPLG
ncbi:type VI secretion system baseplate subunit TssF [Pendulispora albinea]|uniref:Type VI secretion system baseplate subunit TssF n=1 Tax=Pendulispora albinea TaxID=2741071 RepID=A0ABZ2LNZ6_9BACT